MKFSQASQGRIFILRLEDNDQIPEVIEQFAVAQKLEAGLVFFLGGARQGSKVVVGPEDSTAPKPQPMVVDLPDASEAAGVGTLFINEAGTPKLHLHAAFGRKDSTITGCTREGVDIWHIGEVVILELLDTKASRKVDPGTGFELLTLE